MLKKVLDTARSAWHVLEFGLGWLFLAVSALAAFTPDAMFGGWHTIVAIEEALLPLRVAAAVVAAVAGGWLVYRNVSRWVTRRRVRRGLPLPRVFKGRRATLADIVPVVEAGDKEFRSDGFKGRKNRQRYTVELTDVEPNAVWVLEAVDADGVPVIAGYSSAMRLQRDVAAAHLAGSFNQYHLSPRRDLEPANYVPPPGEVPTVFIQAIVLHPSFRGHSDTARAMASMAGQQIGTLLGRSALGPFKLVAEEFSSEGRALMLEYGFGEVGRNSATGHPLWVLDSETPLESDYAGSLLQLIRSTGRRQRPRQRRAA